jgi:hypothetical protein
VYVFPLPEDAAVDHLRMRVGERVVEGQIRERAAARAEYEQAMPCGRAVRCDTSSWRTPTAVELAFGPMARYWWGARPGRRRPS